MVGHDSNPMAEVSRAWGASRLWIVDAPVQVVFDEAICPDRETVVASPLMGDPIACVDLRERGRQARADGLALVVDGGPAGAWGCPALRLGAHMAVASVGDGPVLVGAARDASRALPEACGRLDALPAPTDEELEGLAELVGRAARDWRAASDAAQVVASYLRCHPEVCAVRYPGLRGDPSFEVAARTLQHGFGPVVDYRLSDAAGWERLTCDQRDVRTQVMALERRLSHLGAQYS